MELRWSSGGVGPLRPRRVPRGRRAARESATRMHGRPRLRGVGSLTPGAGGYGALRDRRDHGSDAVHPPRPDLLRRPHGPRDRRQPRHRPGHRPLARRPGRPGGAHRPQARRAGRGRRVPRWARAGRGRARQRRRPRAPGRGGAHRRRDLRQPRPPGRQRRHQPGLRPDARDPPRRVPQDPRHQRGGHPRAGAGGPPGVDGRARRLGRHRGLGGRHQGQPEHRGLRREQGRPGQPDHAAGRRARAAAHPGQRRRPGRGEDEVRRGPVRGPRGHRVQAVPGRPARGARGHRGGRGLPALRRRGWVTGQTMVLDGGALSQGPI